MREIIGAVSHHEREVEELREDPKFAVEYLKAARESLTDPDDHGASLLMLRALAEAYGGLGTVAARAGISRESLYRSLSPKGNPTLKTLIAVLNTMGLSLSVVPQQKKARKRAVRKSAAARRPAKPARLRSRAAA